MVRSKVLDSADPTVDGVAAARDVLRAHFGYADFRPPQVRAVQAVLSGRDALVVLPTGGGKSLCFQVPALMRPGLTIVVSPLISLMKDQVEALERRGIAAAFINSTLSTNETADRLARARDGALRLLYLAPERIDRGRMVSQLATIGVSLLAVDEAHCISEWGHDFRPSYRRVGQIRTDLGAPQAVALTATATPDVRTDVVQQLGLRDAEIVVAGFDRTNLSYEVRATRTSRDKDLAAVQLLRQRAGPGIVYAPTRKAVERVTAMLVRARISAAAYHAGLDDGMRHRAQEAFMQERVRVIVATSAFGMGIDKADVRTVVHHAMPGSLEAYYQEAGRAGRDGRPSHCVLLHAFQDRFTHEYFIANAHPERTVIEQVWRLLRGLADPVGLAAISLDGLQQLLPPKTTDRQVTAAVRVLVSSGACQLEAPAPGRVWVRLTAIPARITAELTDDRAFDREVLRALWRAVGQRLESGASIDLDGLPPGLGGSMGLVPVLERLEAQQFIVWHRIGGGFRLDPRHQAARALSLDWPGLERRRQAELRRLDAMQRYAQSRYCRRAFVLRYFGDPEARASCEACDRCRGVAVGDSEPAERAPSHRSRGRAGPVER